MTTFHAYTQQGQKRVIALTCDDKGQGLPTDKQWVFWKSFEADKNSLKGMIGFGLKDYEAAMKDINTQGYHIYTMERIIKPAP